MYMVDCNIIKKIIKQNFLTVNQIQLLLLM